MAVVRAKPHDPSPAVIDARFGDFVAARRFALAVAIADCRHAARDRA